MRRISAGRVARKDRIFNDMSIPGCLRAILPAAVLCLSSCSAPVPGTGPSGIGVQGGDAVEAVLFGGGPCTADRDCPAGLCAVETCVGFLMIPSEGARNAVGAAISEAARKNPTFASGIAAVSARVVGDTGADTFMRSRAADVFRFLPCSLSGAAGTALEAAISDPDQAVRFFAARSMAACGNGRAADVVRQYLDHDSEAVRAMAAAAVKAERAQ